MTCHAQAPVDRDCPDHRCIGSDTLARLGPDKPRRLEEPAHRLQSRRASWNRKVGGAVAQDIGSRSRRDPGRRRATARPGSLSCRCRSPRYPWIRARVRPVGPGSGARWLPRRRAVFVFGGRRERVTGGDAANSVSGDTRPEARRIPGSGAVHRRGRRGGSRPAWRCADRLGIVGHSRGGGETLQYLLAIGNVQAAVLHSAGHGYRPVTRVAEFNVPMLILHGTADGPADGGGVNTQVALAVLRSVARNRIRRGASLRRRWSQHLLHELDSARRRAQDDDHLPATPSRRVAFTRVETRLASSRLGDSRRPEGIR